MPSKRVYVKLSKFEDHYGGRMLRAGSDRSYTGVAPEVCWSYTGVALEVCWSYTGVALEVCWSYTVASIFKVMLVLARTLSAVFLHAVPYHTMSELFTYFTIILRFINVRLQIGT